MEQSYYLYFKWQEDIYRFPIGINVITGKMLRELISKYDLFATSPYSNVWLENQDQSLLIAENTVLILNPNYVTLIGDKWKPHYDNNTSRYIANLDTYILQNAYITFT